MNYLEAAKAYYAQWTDVPTQALNQPRILAVQSSKRDSLQPGYSRPFNLFCLVRHHTVIISYSATLQDKMPAIMKTFETSKALQDREIHLKRVFPNLSHLIKFNYQGPPPSIDLSDVVELRLNHYDQFLRFFKNHAPDCDAETWLFEYYGSLVERGYAFGIFKNDELISATDAPDIPYMNEIIVEIGINTLEAYRGKGYAKLVVTAMLKHLLHTGKVPIWSCGASNRGSERLALSVGYQRFADILCTSPEK